MHQYVNRAALLTFEQIEGELYRFPAIDPASFRLRVADVLGG